jgi:signal transduction histidine kinase
VNAAKHAGTGAVAVYAEVEGERIEVYVRDRGRGFDPDAVAPDRHGIRDSIKGRLARHGGRATVTSTPGEGAEVTLELPT